ncbi:hypothetical protein CC86DRAFT_448836 [Ophiobolus disseminans]|uniref:RING-type domain-containing protein n=1 Tax=Ophiobolus disseminans TaxID=1469910 RepID=A0A6A6ZKD5_9PLEO|nr:hypothetical protein CC86DRAFT_448836 [Ophiobolus disseminans]
MANPAVDPKAAPLTEDLKEYALTLPTSAFPKNFFCALCSELAVDSYKLLCCNKVICPSCQEKLAFPTTCPSCDHSPLEADSCMPNKTLRNTMRIWLQKQKKKEDAKAAAQATPTPVDTPAPAEVQQAGDAEDKPVDSIEEAPKADIAGGEQTAEGDAGDADQRAGSAPLQTTEDPTAPPNDATERRASNASQSVTKSVEPSATGPPTEEQNNASGPNGMIGSNPMMMNGMAGQMPYGFPNQAGYNNGMYGMNGMSNMMGNSNWNGMNSMDFNSMNGMPNGMYGNYGGNMGMGMNDMSAMNYGGGYGGWNGMGGGYNQYNNGYNQMGGHNQSGAYPEMMNQFPKNNFSNQNQNRFPANQGGQYPQRNMRNGSHGGFGPGHQHANSRPGSRGGHAPNRDGQSPDGTANTASDAKAGDEQAKAPAESTEEGKANIEGTAESTGVQAAPDAATSGTAGDSTDPKKDGAEDTPANSGLNPIQTFDSGDADMNDFNQPMMSNGMPYHHGMMNQGFDQSHMDPSFDPSMGMGYNNYGPRGGFNNGAYGAAKVLIDQPAEPIGVGVVGAPTGPRAMREGRPNTGFSSRVNSARFVPPARSVTSARESAAPNSPQRRVRSRSPMRDESLRVKHKSPSRSRSRSRDRDEVKDDNRERSRSADRESRRAERVRSVTPKVEADLDDQNERQQHRSSKYDARDAEYEDRYRDDRGSRGDRTRSASVDSKSRSSRRDKDKQRSSRSHRDRSKEHRRRHRSRSAAEDVYEEDKAYVNGERESDGGSRRKHRSEKDKYRDRSRDRERDRKDRKERDRDYDYERSREKDKDRKRRRDREGEEDERDYEDDKHRSSRRSRKDRDRERSSRHDERDRDDRDYKDEKKSTLDKEEDIVGAMMKKRPVSPPLNAPTGPSANGFSIKGRSKNVMPPPVQPPTGPRSTFQPPKGPAADRNRSEPRDHRRKSSAASIPSSPKDKPTSQDHYAAERERNARERDSRDRPTPSLSSRIKRSRDDEPEPPRGPRAETKQPPSGPSSHRDKRRKSGTTGDDNIANLFTAGLRKNAKRRGGVRIEGEEGRDVERVERERERR